MCYIEELQNTQYKLGCIRPPYEIWTIINVYPLCYDPMITCTRCMDTPNLKELYAIITLVK